MTRLNELENESLYILREARRRLRNPALLWSCGKDSTVLLWLCRKAFFGEIPFPVVHVDTGRKFQAIYECRDRLAREWGLDLVVSRNEEAIAAGAGPHQGVVTCCGLLKTDPLKNLIAERGYDGLLVGIRRDEHGVRSKERVFSPRESDFSWRYDAQRPELLQQFQADRPDGGHVRVHPILSWTEEEIWAYVQREAIPVVDLYFAKAGRRYRSIGCECCCSPVDSTAATVPDLCAELSRTDVGERAGRAHDKSGVATMQKLRALGYM